MKIIPTLFVTVTFALVNAGSYAQPVPELNAGNEQPTTEGLPPNMPPGYGGYSGGYGGGYGGGNGGGYGGRSRY